ncbi:hypothetical protein [Nocardia sp. NPDC004722]
MASLDWTSDVTTGPAGIGTEEAGILSGEVTIRTFWSDADKSALVTVRHQDVGEWYTMSGGPVTAASESAAAAVHQAAVAHASRDSDAG